MRSETPRPGGGRPWRALLAWLVAALPCAFLFAPGVPAAAEQTPQTLVENALMCYCGCTDLMVRTCTCGTAARIKDDIAQRLASGQTVDQVIEAYVAQHGEKIRSAPTRRGFNLLAWVMPFAAILTAGIWIVVRVRRWAAFGAGPPATVAGAPRTLPLADLPGADRKRLDRIERELRQDL